MGATWGRQDPGEPHVGLMNRVIRDYSIWNDSILKIAILLHKLQNMFGSTWQLEIKSRALDMNEICRLTLLWYDSSQQN